MSDILYKIQRAYFSLWSKDTPVNCYVSRETLYFLQKYFFLNKKEEIIGGSIFGMNIEIDKGLSNNIIRIFNEERNIYLYYEDIL